MDIVRQQKATKYGQCSWFEAGQGPGLVLLHGGGGTGKAWWAQMQALKDRYRVIALDMPGFGQSDQASEVRTVADISPVVLEWVSELGLDHFILGGNSMGGRVSLSMASQAPSRVDALILLDSVGVHIDGIPIVNPLTLPADRYMAGLVYDPENYKRLTPYRTLDDAKELNRGRQSFARYLAESPIGPDPTLELKRVTMPSLLIWGRHDQIVPLAYGQALKNLLTDAELFVIEECGHLPHIEAPSITNQAISDFLSGHDL